MQLTKHHGLGNDFLVVVDIDEQHPIDADIAVALCDRHRGVGADGLIRVTPGADAPVAMELRNEDGSRAAMSGNGISCLAQAVVRAGHATERVDVETDAGLRSVEVVESVGPTRHRMRVSMGTPAVAGADDDWLGPGVLAALRVDVGNPHLVLQVDDHAPDLVEIGLRANQEVAGGINVELIRVASTTHVDMTVYERGVGPTRACGTGAVAAATAAHAWGLVEAATTVAQPGGDAVVDLAAGGTGAAHLTVPVVAVAAIEWLRPRG